MAVIKRLSHYTPSPMIKEVVEEQLASMKQGIVTILHSDPETPAKSTSSIRRTLSADMSSKNWLSQNGFSSQQPQSNGSNPQGQDDVWRSIQSQKEIKDQSEPIPDLILTNQRAHGNNKPPCYVPLLTKRSSSTLSTKSLEICTESLGSETGSDSVLSSYRATPRSKASDDHQERQRNQTQLKDSIFYEKLSVVKYRNAPARPFPPPIHSISGYGDSLHLQARRENGRLVLEAVSVPPRNYFHARRGNGRLVLTLINHRKESDRVDGFDDENKEDQDNDKHEVVERELGSFLPPNRIISVHKPSLMVKTTFISPGARNPSWIGNNKTAKIIEDEEKERDQLRISKSLPPPSPRVSSWMIPKPQTHSSFEGYGYFWRNKTKGAFINPVITNNTKNVRLDYNDNIYVAKEYMNRDVVVMMTRGGKVESFVSYLKGCKEPKRSTLTWEPYCIATS